LPRPARLSMGRWSLRGERTSLAPLGKHLDASPDSPVRKLSLGSTGGNVEHPDVVSRLGRLKGGGAGAARRRPRGAAGRAAPGALTTRAATGRWRSWSRSGRSWPPGARG